MKQLTIFFKILLIAIFFSACSNSGGAEDNNVQNSTGDYWPTKIDNNWVYAQDGAETSIKITGTDEINGDKKYLFNQLPIFGRAVGPYPTSIKKDKGDYYIKIEEINNTAEGTTSSSTAYEFLFFKDYLNVNETWEGTYMYTESYNGANLLVARSEVTYTGVILEKGISLTVNGTVFMDVIKFRFTQIVDGKDDAWPTWDYSTDYWIAKNVGIIKFEHNEDISEIKSFVIK